MADKKLSQLTEQDSIGENDNGYVYFVNNDGDSRKLSLETLKSDVIEPTAQRGIASLQSDLEAYIARVCSRNIPRYHDGIQLSLKIQANTPKKYIFHAPFDGILNFYLNSYFTYKINDVNVGRYASMHTGYKTISAQPTEFYYRQVEFQLGDKIEVYVGTTSGADFHLVPLTRTEIDRNSALIMEFDATPGEFHTKIQEAKDDGKSPFYWDSVVSVEQMGVYGSRASACPSIDNIATSPGDWTLITDENESWGFKHYAIYCPTFSDDDHNRYIFGYDLYDPESGAIVKSYVSPSYYMNDTTWGTTKQNGQNLITFSNGNVVANKLKFKVYCIKLLDA